MADRLPNHVPIKISPDDIGKFDDYLIQEGYEWVFLQVVKPKQLMGKVKTIERHGKTVEHHVRVFTDGKITTEYELQRVKEMWMHLTTVSYSAHEQIIEFLEKIGIQYTYDENLRERYNKEAIDDYPRRYFEFIEWLFAGVIFWSPLGYTWKFYYSIKKRLNGKYSGSTKISDLPGK